MPLLRQSLIPGWVVVCLTSTIQGQCPEKWCPGEPFPGLNGEVWTTTRWTPPESGEGGELLVVGGRFSVAGDQQVQNIAAWSGMTWHTVSAINPDYFLLVTALTVLNGELVASGWTDPTEPFATVAVLRNGQWQAIIDYMSDSASVLTVFRGELYAGGYFDFLDADNNNPIGLARWDGKYWHQVGDLFYADIRSMTEHQGDLVIAGDSLLALINGVVHLYEGVARFDGVTWHDVGNGIHGPVLAAASVGGELYAGGLNLYTGGNPAGPIVRLDGSQWTTVNSNLYGVKSISSWAGEVIVAGLVNYDDSGISAYRWNGANWLPLGQLFTSGSYTTRLVFTNFKGSLYSFGNFVSNGLRQPRRIARWTGSDWIPLGGGIDGRILSFISWNGQLVVGGVFTSNSNSEVRNIAIHTTDGQWLPLGEGFNGSVAALAVYRGELIAGGYFSKSGTTTVNRIARWDGHEWKPLGQGIEVQGYFYLAVNALATYGDKLFVGGDFRAAGGQPARSLAEWDGCRWSPVNGMAIEWVRSFAYWGCQLVAMGYGHTAFYDGVDWHRSQFASSEIMSAVEWNGDLYATTSSYLPSFQLLRWTGIQWQSYQAGPSNGSQTSGRALLLYQGKLIFSGVDYSNASFVYSWNGAEREKVGSEWDGVTWAIGEDQGDLVLGGAFSSASGVNSAFLARHGSVGPRPVITYQPASPMLCEGSAVSIRTIASGEGEIAYQWRRNGHPLTNDEDTLGTQSETLVFMHAAACDDGIYDCVVTLGGCTQATSNIATLSVLRAGSGDGNNDGLTDGCDIQLFIRSLLEISPDCVPLCVFDFTGDGAVTGADVSGYVGRLLTP